MQGGTQGLPQQAETFTLFSPPPPLPLCLASPYPPILNHSPFSSPPLCLPLGPPCMAEVGVGGRHGESGAWEEEACKVLTYQRGSGRGGPDALPGAEGPQGTTLVKCLISSLPICTLLPWLTSPSHLPVTATPQDLPSAVGEEDLTHCLELRDLKGRSAMVMPVCAYDGTGVREGVTWLVEAVRKSQRADLIKQRADVAAAFRYGSR
ncbi:unnamed protein product [Closterium sp. Naga37s-1]|nr:unnamed protein product [Closterium sp. Naga37s-1]